MAYQILLAGQDITMHVDQMSIEIDDTLGQGPGAGAINGTSARATTCKFNTDLGPMNKAIGAGQSIPLGDSSILLDGSSGYVSLPSTLKTDGWSAFTAELWLKLSNNTFSYYPRLITNEDHPSTSHVGFELYASPTTDGGAGYFVVGNGTTSAIAFFGSGFFTAGNWYHLVATFDGSNLRTYVNGVLTKTQALAGSIGTATSPIVIGKDAAALGDFLPGYLNEIALYHSVLSPTRIQAHYSLGSSGAKSAAYASAVLSDNPYTYYHVDETSGNTFSDSSVNDFVGTAVGGVALGQPGFLSSTPALVRQGEVVVTDATGTIVFGGYATKFVDITTSNSGLGINTHPHTEVDAIDYTSALGRTMVNTTFSSQTDVQVISQTLTQYAPWVNQSLLPATGLFLLPAEVFRNKSVLQVIQKVAGITGWIVWVDFHKKIHYTSPANTQSAPFYLSDQPDFITSFPHAVTDFEIDDTSAINRVYFYGGKKTSNDFIQDISPQANGSNKVFTLAYYPRVASDGLFHVTKVTNFSDNLVVGIANGTTPPNILKSQGGLADVLVNPDAHNITFDVAPAACTGCVLIKYRYNFPLSIVVADQNSVNFFGTYLDGYVSDDTVFDQIEGIQRAKVVLTQQSFGLVTLKIDTWHGGLQAGQTVQVVNAVRGINQAYLIQEVVTDPLGAGNFVWHVTLGAWNWHLIDVIVKLAAIAPVDDTSDTEDTSVLQIYQLAGNVVLHDAWTHSDTMHRGPYYARASAVGDGHDAFPGFSTVST